MSRPIAVAPDTRPKMHAALSGAVTAVGGLLVDPKNAEGLIWADPARADLFPSVVEDANRLEWIQLPYAGVEPFANHLDGRWSWTCGKGVYAPAVAEMVVGLSLALTKNLHVYARADTWSSPVGRYLNGSRTTILGGGGITRALVPMLRVFDCPITVVRRSEETFESADRTTTVDYLLEVLPNTDLLILALALTEETRGIIDGNALGQLPDNAILINVARGSHIVTDDLVAALASGRLAGAALDVTDPEPLPDGHPLWSEQRCLLTPHVANTPEMGLDLLAPFVEENVRRFLQGEPLLGRVDLQLGY